MGMALGRLFVDERFEETAKVEVRMAFHSHMRVLNKSNKKRKESK